VPRPLVVGLAVGVVLATASAVRAERLLTPLLADAVPGEHAGLPGVARARALALGRTALAALRGRALAALEAFPLGVDRTVDLDLARIEPFAPGARVQVVRPDGVHDVPLPDAVYFAGTVRGVPASRALLVAGRDEVHGFVAMDGEAWAFGRDPTGMHRTYALRDVSLERHPPPGDFCGTDLYPSLFPPPRPAADVTGAAPRAPIYTSDMELRVAVAVDTDVELWNHFGSDEGTLDYLASLLAAANVVYERDLKLRLQFSYVRLWSAEPDPWTAADTVGALYEVQDYWTTYDVSEAGPHDLVHFVSGKAVNGGVAWVGTVCDASYGFGASQVYGSFDTSDPSQIWDVLVVTHEIGHNLGTEHTHCYDPPIDRCYAQEAGCYKGTVVPSRGEIMSYCHLLGGGLGNIDMQFTQRVVDKIRSVVDDAACLAPVTPPVCGNGIREYGEECDDGNTTDGDGCTATCLREPRCGDGFLDAGEQCDDGGTADGDGCSATCRHEPRCGDGTLDAGEECDDGDVVDGDGCSAICRREPCLVVSALQRLWAGASLSMRHARRGDVLSVVGDFGLSPAVGPVVPTTTGVHLMLEGQAGMALDAVLPASAWRRHGTRWTYRDPKGRIGGLRSVVLRIRAVGGAPDIGLTVKGKGVYAITPGTPLTAFVLFGDEGAKLAGACGRYTFPNGACTARGRTRLVCR